MLKTLFGQKYTKAFIDRVAWRKAQILRESQTQNYTRECHKDGIQLVA